MRVQELTSATVDFVVCDLRPVNIVDSVRFLHLMKGLSPDTQFPAGALLTSNKFTYIAIHLPINQSISNYEVSNSLLL